MLALIAAIDPNNTIGKNNTIPWSILEERQLFHQLTQGHPVIMGRKTFESLPRPLPNRTNIIISKQQQGDLTFPSLQTALHHAHQLDENIFIIGGGEVYHQAIDLADTLYISHLNQTYPGDTFFPEINPKHWQPTAERGYAEFRFITYKRH